MNKPYIKEIIIKHDLETDPNLDFLQQDYTCDEVTVWENEKYQRQDKQRLDDYYKGNWHMIGIEASTDLWVDFNGYSQIIGNIHSGGLWGNESDFDDAIKENDKEQLEELKDILNGLGIEVKENITIRIDE